MLLQRGIIMGSQLRLEPGLQFRLFLRGSTRDGFGLHMTLLSVLFQIAFECCQRDAKHLHNLGSQVALVYRPEHSFS